MVGRIRINGGMKVDGRIMRVVYDGVEGMGIRRRRVWVEWGKKVGGRV